MAIRNIVRQLAQRGLQSFGYNVVSDSVLYDWQREQSFESPGQRTRPPDGADAYLRPDNPRLLMLRHAYQAADQRVTTPVRWTADFVTPEQMHCFRAHSPYVWQRTGRANDLTYTLAYYYTTSKRSPGGCRS
jgi:hypothetical protein